MSENENIEKTIEMEEPMDAQNDEILNESLESDSQVDAENTIAFKRSHLYAVLLPLAFVAGLAFGFIFFSISFDFRLRKNCESFKQKTRKSAFRKNCQRKTIY